MAASARLTSSSAGDRLALNAGDPDARPQLDGPGRELERVAQRLADAVRHLHGHLGSRDAPQEHEELVASQAPDIVVAATRDLQALRDQDEQLVAGGVAQGVVDRLEVVEIDIDDPVFVASSARARVPTRPRIEDRL